MNTQTAPYPVVIIDEISRTQVSFVFNKFYVERFMQAILTDFPESKFFVAEPENVSNN